MMPIYTSAYVVTMKEPKKMKRLKRSVTMSEADQAKARKRIKISPRYEAAILGAGEFINNGYKEPKPKCRRCGAETGLIFLQEEVICGYCYILHG